MNEDDVRALVHAELAKISNERLKRALETCLIEPRPCLLEWDYGHRHKQFAERRYPGFIVGEHRESRTGFAWSEYGFGPRSPWGHVDLDNPGYGDDTGWFASLEAAFRSSCAWDEHAPPDHKVD